MSSSKKQSSAKRYRSKSRSKSRSRSRSISPSLYSSSPIYSSSSNSVDEISDQVFYFPDGSTVNLPVSPSGHPKVKAKDYPGVTSSYPPEERDWESKLAPSGNYRWWQIGKARAEEFKMRQREEEEGVSRKPQRKKLNLSYLSGNVGDMFSIMRQIADQALPLGPGKYKFLKSDQRKIKGMIPNSVTPAGSTGVEGFVQVDDENSGYVKFSYFHKDKNGDISEMNPKYEFRKQANGTILLNPI